MTEVRLANVRFFSPMDEDAFFEWLNKLGSIGRIYGEGPEIVLQFKEASVSDADMHELIAVLRRYGIDRSLLRTLVSGANEVWLRSWEPEIFK